MDAPVLAATPGSAKPALALHGAQRARVEWRALAIGVAVIVAVTAGASCSKSSPEATTSAAPAWPSNMGPLEAKTNRQGRDLSIGGELAQSAAECAARCAVHQRCAAMSYSTGSAGEPGRCWMKESVPAATPNDLMTSSVKLHAASSP